MRFGAVSPMRTRLWLTCTDPEIGEGWLAMIATGPQGPLSVVICILLRLTRWRLYH
jgi:hypothetical protein